jgi:hypothetical protein
MTDKTAPTPLVVTESMPASAGQISALASANAPFIYFDNASFYGLFNDIGQITMEATRLMAGGPDGRVALDRVVTGHLRCSLPELRNLRAAIDPQGNDPPPGALKSATSASPCGPCRTVTSFSFRIAVF